MPDSDPSVPAARAASTGTYRPAEPDVMPRAAESEEGPTVLSGGSSNRRRSEFVPLPAPGERVDSFEVEEPIGVGGMGAVFRALDTRLDRQVALKVLPPEQSGDAEVVRRFVQEGRAAARLDHENIARVFTIGQDKGVHFIAFEYIEGTNIRQRVERGGPLPVAEAINYTLQIAGALVHAAERGVVHRDIKPSNIIVTPQGRAKLVDMGLARHFERGAADDGLTQSGMTLGTFDYISPEQARDPRDVDVRSDLYSLGCTLFHMLTGRPPFPEGTVLQKLLQHQEDPPPDVRSLNAAVPPDLAAILAKLMAKDRDRRYQTPEQLVRDLLTVAGSLGLRSVSPEGLVWMGASRPPSWERHLFWGVPATVLVVIVLVLVWWGQDTPQGEPPLAVEPAAGASATTAGKAGASKASAPSKAIEPEPAAAAEEVVAESRRTVTLKAADDLLGTLAAAPRGATITLVEDGPYELRPPSQGPGRPRPLERRDLTLRAAPGARPVLRLAEGAGRSGAAGALLHFVGGRVAIEGLEFLVEPGDRDDAAAAIRADRTDLTLTRCLFRRRAPGREAGRGGHSAAVEVRAQAPTTAAEWPATTRVVGCFFGPGQAGIVALGPAEVVVRDCTFGAAEPALRLDDPEGRGGPSAPARLWLAHDSILAGEGPVLRFGGVGPVVRCDDTVVAPGRDGRAILVVADDPDALDWAGRGNVYARVGTFLQPARDLPRDPIWDFATWADDPAAASAREAGSIAVEGQVWDEADPASLLARRDPAPAFRLAALDLDGRAPGARVGPFGPLPRPAAAVVAKADGDDTPTPLAPSRPKATAEPTRPRPTPTTPATVAAATPASRPPREPAIAPDPEAVVAAPMPVKSAEDPVEDANPPLNDPGRDMPDPTVADDSPMVRKEDPEAPRAPTPATATPKPRADAATEPTPPAAPRPEDEPGDGAAVVRTSGQFLAAWQRLGPRGGTIRLAADADLALGPLEVRGAGRWAIEAAPGATRPRLRYRPEPAEPRAPGGWSALFRVHSGSLQVQGVDVELPQADDLADPRRAAFALRAGAELDLAGCTVTVAGMGPAAAVAVQGADLAADDPGAMADPPAASIRVADSLLRGGGNLIEVAAGRPLDLDVLNAVLAAGGAVVHGRGAARGQAPPTLRLDLRRATVRAAGGLVQLEGAPNEPELPVADLGVRDSVLATTPQGDPLVRVDGQDALESLRDRVHWEGHGVAYHRIETYRRDQSAQLGTVPVAYDRPSWDLAVGLRDEAPIHGDLRFLRPWDAGRPAWALTRADVRLAADSPARAAGADLDRVPAPPSS